MYQSIIGTCHPSVVWGSDSAAPLICFSSICVEWRVWQWWCISNYFRAGSILVLVMMTTVVVIDMRMYAQSACRSGTTTSWWNVYLSHDSKLLRVLGIECGSPESITTCKPWPASLDVLLQLLMCPLCGLPWIIMNRVNIFISLEHLWRCWSVQIWLYHVHFCSSEEPHRVEMHPIL